MAVMIQAGEIGSIEPYAINGFEGMTVGPLNGSVITLGEADSGDCHFDDAAEVGRRT